MPRSYNPPHRVIFKGRNRFWARTSIHKYEPNVEELRHLFNAGPQLADRIRNFRMEQIARISGGWTPIPSRPVIMEHRCQLALHIVPYSAFDLQQLITVDRQRGANLFPTVRPRRAEHHVTYRFSTGRSCMA